MLSPTLSDSHVPQRSDHRHHTWARPVRPWNPLHDDLTASRRSSYLGPVEGGLRHLLDNDRICGDAETAVHREVERHILGEGFPCVAARSVLHRATYRLGLYDTLGSLSCALALCHDLYEFSHEFKPHAPSDRDGTRFTSFIAVFQRTPIASEVHFEQLLWRHLQAMHGIDARHFDWDGTVSKDPDNPDFSFSLGGRAFFVVGLNPCSSRLSRRFGMPCLVFNPHAQFDALRAQGKYDRMRDAIRERDLAFQGSLNPMLSNFGQQPESRQYSGRAVPSQWQCPFHALHAHDPQDQATRPA